MLDRLAEQIDERAETLARIAVREMGERITEARREVALIAAIARYFSAHAATLMVLVAEG